MNNRNIDIINTIRLEIGDKHEYIQRSGCHNCKNGDKWDPSGVGTCMKHSMEFKKALKRKGLDEMDFHVFKYDICNDWELD